MSDQIRIALRFLDIRNHFERSFARRSHNDPAVVYDTKTAPTAPVGQTTMSPLRSLTRQGAADFGLNRRCRQARQPCRAWPTTPPANKASPAINQGSGFKCCSQPLAVPLCQQVVPGPARCSHAT